MHFIEYVNVGHESLRAKPTWICFQASFFLLLPCLLTLGDDLAKGDASWAGARARAAFLARAAAGAGAAAGEAAGAGAAFDFFEAAFLDGGFSSSCFSSWSRDCY